MHAIVVNSRVLPSCLLDMIMIIPSCLQVLHAQLGSFLAAIQENSAFLLMECAMGIVIAQDRSQLMKMKTYAVSSSSSSHHVDLILLI